MIGSFEYNNVKSRTFDLICRSVKRPLIPSLRPKTVNIYGKSGVIDYDNNDYNTRQIIMHLAYIGKNYIDLRSKARDIASWLSLGKWARLIINDEPDKYYLAKIVNEIDLETLKRLGEADIVFECQPFAYRVFDTGEDLTWEEANFPWVVADTPWTMSDAYTFTATGLKTFTFYNPGTKIIDISSPQGSKNQIKINGSWTTLNISLNGKTLDYIEAGTGELVIDNVEMEVKLNGTNKLSVIDGDIDSFLPILPSENIMQVSGTGLNITVTIDFSPMWL